MKIRMYLRGLGIGIAVTALVLGIFHREIPDEEVISRAQQLGMVREDTSLQSMVSDRTDEEAPAAASETVKEEMPAPESEKEAAVPEPEKEPASAPEPEKEETAAVEPQKEAAMPETEKEETAAVEPAKESSTAKSDVITTGTFTIDIAGGSDSVKVCRLLQKGGAIASAEEFDEYLCAHGYDSKITTGRHVIPAGSDYETIAEIITSR